MSHQEVVTRLKKMPFISAGFFERLSAVHCRFPLMNKNPAPLMIRDTQALEEARDGTGKRLSKSYCNCEFMSFRQIQLAGESYVPVFSLIEFEIHFIVPGQVCVSVTVSDVSAGELGEITRSTDNEPAIVFLCDQQLPARDFHHKRVVAFSSYLQMGRAQHVGFQMVQEVAASIQFCVQHNAGAGRLHDDFFRKRELSR